MPLLLSSAEQALADALLTHSVDLFRLEAHIREHVLRDLDALGAELERAARDADLSSYSKARINKILAAATEMIDSYYEKMQGRVEEVMPGIARSRAMQTAGHISGMGLDSVMPAESFLERLATNVIIQGAPSADWWSRQAGDVRFRFATAVRQGLLAGETNEQIVRRIVGSPTAPGVMDIPRRNARALVHSSVQAVANRASLESFRKNADVILGLRQLSTLDSKTTPICIAYSGQEWELETLKPMTGSTLPFNGGPPRHWNCRSVLIPITKSFRSLGLDIDEFLGGKRAAQGGAVASDMSFAAFLKRKGADWQDEVLGPSRAQMWRDGSITLQQLVDMKGNPLTLAQLEARYGSR